MRPRPDIIAVHIGIYLPQVFQPTTLNRVYALDTCHYKSFPLSSPSAIQNFYHGSKLQVEYFITNCAGVAARSRNAIHHEAHINHIRTVS